MARSSGGRPTKYSGEFCDHLIRHMSNGGSIKSFAAKIGVSRETLYSWTQVHDDFSYAFERGQACLELWFENLFKQMAMGRLVRSKRTTKKKNGDITVEYEYTNGNATAAIFMAQNMIHWRNRKDVQVTGDSSGQAKYSDLTENEMKKLIKDGLEILGCDIPLEKSKK